jgi:amidase
MTLKASEYRRLDATALAGLIHRGEIAPAEAVEAALREIERRQPELNALVWQDPDRARRLAEVMPTDRPFAGVPLLLKDAPGHHLAGAPTAEGCTLHRDRVMAESSHLVHNLLDAGFVIPGRTNVPEFCLKATTEPHAFGATRNPRDQDRIPGGSSGGSAAAVASGMVPLATGSDGGGSIRIPAAYCGLFGLKPSRGRVSQGPHHGEIWQGLSSDHVLSRSVRDSAAVLDLISGERPGDPYGIRPPEESFTQQLNYPPGRLRVALSTRSPLGGEVHPDHVRATREAARVLEDMGHVVEEAEPEVDGHAVAACYLMLYFGEMAAEAARIRTQHGNAALAGLEPDTRMLALQGETYAAGDFVRHRDHWNDFARALGDFFGRYDLYLTPTTAQPPARIGEQDMPLLETVGSRAVASLGLGRLARASGRVTRLAIEPLARVPFTQLANFCGAPAMSVPLGQCEQGRLPCGVHFMAARGEDALLLQLAGQLEQAIPWPNPAEQCD